MIRPCTVAILLLSIAYGVWAYAEPGVAEPFGIAYVAAVVTLSLVWIMQDRHRR